MNITLSILSNIPPCPGIKLLKSLISTYLFILDAEKSPICPTILNTIDIKIVFIYENCIWKNVLNIYVNSNDKHIAPIIPPKHPSIVLFGLILLNLCFPIHFPNIYANISVPQAQANIYHTKNFP